LEEAEIGFLKDKGLAQSHAQTSQKKEKMTKNDIGPRIHKLTCNKRFDLIKFPTKLLDSF